MTNRIKTVQKPKVIMVCCRDSERISEIISDILNFSQGTVRNYLSTILEKLGLRDRTQLAIWALERRG